VVTKPSPTDVAVGQKITAAGWNRGVQDAYEFWDLTRPVCYLSQSVGQAIATGTATFTPVTFTNEVIDRDGQHDNAVNTSRIVIGKTLGWYEVSGAVSWATGTSGGVNDTRRAGVLFNGAVGPLTEGGQISIPYTTGTALCTVVVPPILVLATAATDYVELGAAHTAGVSQSTLVSGGFRSSFRAVYIGSA
jgi:hypothetical protein